MSLTIFADDRWLTSRLARQRLSDRVRLHVKVFGASVAWLAVVFLASAIDGTTTLDGIGRGSLEHGGYIALHLATPVALSLALVALEYFAKLMNRLSSFLRPGCDIAVIERTKDERLAVLNLRSNWTWLLLLFVVAGALCSTAVLLQVIDPSRTYGNDVFNACQYPFGYYTANIYLAASWTIVFPFTLFVVLQITASLVIVLNTARKESALAVDLLHSDDCGGLSPFGELNVWLMLHYVPPFLAMSALAATHARSYASLLIPAAALSLVFVVQSVVGVYAIHLAVRSEKKARLDDLRLTLQHALEHPTCAGERELPFLLWQHVRGVKTMPYAANIQMVVGVLRYVPPAIAIYNIVRAHP
jgi:hypothetical protein